MDPRAGSADAGAGDRRERRAGQPLSFLLHADGTVGYDVPSWVPLLARLQLRDARGREVERRASPHTDFMHGDLQAAVPIASLDLDVMTTAYRMSFDATIGPIGLVANADHLDPTGVATIHACQPVDLVASLGRAGRIPAPPPPLHPAATPAPATQPSRNF